MQEVLRRCAVELEPARVRMADERGDLVVVLKGLEPVYDRCRPLATPGPAAPNRRSRGGCRPANNKPPWRARTRSAARTAPSPIRDLRPLVRTDRRRADRALEPPQKLRAKRRGGIECDVHRALAVEIRGAARRLQQVRLSGSRCAPKPQCLARAFGDRRHVLGCDDVAAGDERVEPRMRGARQFQRKLHHRGGSLRRSRGALPKRACSTAARSSTH